MQKQIFEFMVEAKKHSIHSVHAKKIQNSKLDMGAKHEVA